jgi:hypothetical protein
MGLDESEKVSRTAFLICSGRWLTLQSEQAGIRPAYVRQADLSALARVPRETGI